MRSLFAALLTVGVLAACAGQPTSPKQAVTARHDLVCRSGYVVTSGRDSVCADPQ